MKKLIGFNEEIGGDGLVVGGQVGVEASSLKLELSASFPIAKIIEPATAAVDSLIDKLKAAIPGNWDDVILDQAKQEYKEELVKLLSEPAPEPQPEAQA